MKAGPSPSSLGKCRSLDKFSTGEALRSFAFVLSHTFEIIAAIDVTLLVKVWLNAGTATTSVVLNLIFVLVALACSAVAA